jgi:hypothetical protein
MYQIFNKMYEFDAFIVKECDSKKKCFFINFYMELNRFQ